jgi:small GTP-binding protein
MENKSNKSEKSDPVSRPSLVQPNELNYGKQYDYLFKVSLIGDSGCGKTSIIIRFTDGVFQDNTYSTIGVDFKVSTVKYENTFTKLQIWDTCGSERFRSLTTAFFKSCQIFVIIFDITNRKSFENIDEWIKTIKNSTNPKFMVLVGNKCDLESLRVVSSEEGRTYAQNHIMHYLETSAKSGENVEQIFVHIAEKLIKEINKKKNDLSININPGSDYIFELKGKEIKGETSEKKNKSSQNCGC